MSDRAPWFAALCEAFERIVSSDLFDGSHVSLDCDRRGGLSVNIAPDWLCSPALRALTDLARDLELSVALTEDGVRIESHSSETVRGVDAVKETLRLEREDGEDDDD